MQKAVERFVLISWVDRHRDMNRDGPRLPNPVNPVITLLLYGRVPPAREVNYVCGSRERQTRASRLGSQYQKVKPFIKFQVSLEPVHYLLTAWDRGTPIDQIDPRQV